MPLYTPRHESDGVARKSVDIEDGITEPHQTSDGDGEQSSSASVVAHDGGAGTGSCGDPAGNALPAPMRNMYTAAIAYNGYTITDGALRLIVLFNAARLGFTAIEIAVMFSMYEVR